MIFSSGASRAPHDVQQTDSAERTSMEHTPENDDTLYHNSDLSSLSFQTVSPMTAPSLSSYFQSTYQEARTAFLNAARAAGARLSHHIPPSLQNHDPELAIDVAEWGPDDAEHVLLHISGTHGVEGYTGSAIQTAILEDAFELPPNTKLFMIHALNPYGMAYNRRVNESNVDINRNCFRDESKRGGTPDYYDVIDPVINPTSPPGRWNMFYIKAAIAILQHGFQALKQAVAGGQYEYPKGLYYGGDKTEDSVSFLETFVQQRCSQARDLTVIDIHTGLGEYGKELLMIDYKAPQNIDSLCKTYFGKDPFRSERTGIAYEASGQLSQGIAALLPDQKVYWFTQEFGTYHPVRVASALRQENRYHHYGEGLPEHRSKQVLVDTFNPPDLDWRNQVVRRGKDVFQQALRLCANHQDSTGTGIEDDSTKER